jgi:hypothetical protein
MYHKDIMALYIATHHIYCDKCKNEDPNCCKCKCHQKEIVIE